MVPQENSQPVKYTDVYQEVVDELSEEGRLKLNQLILLERAANQRHWLNRLDSVAVRLSEITKDMREEADRYDSPRKT